MHVISSSTLNYQKVIPDSQVQYKSPLDKVSADYLIINFDNLELLTDQQFQIIKKYLKVTHVAVQTGLCWLSGSPKGWIIRIASLWNQLQFVQYRMLFTVRGSSLRIIL